MRESMRAFMRVRFGFLAAVLAAMVAVGAMGCASSRSTETSAGVNRTGQSAVAPAQTPGGGQRVPKQYPAPPPMQIDPNKRYAATIETTLGTITAELYAKEAPQTVNNFVFLAREGFYDGVIFHRVIKGFMIQTGDPTGTGRGGPGYRFADEIPPNRDYEPGTLAMANAGPNTNGSQFFICHVDLRGQLPKNYSIFGRVTQGMDIVDKIASVPTRLGADGANSAPINEVKITRITIQES